MTAKRFVIRGRVQAVGFRWSAQQLADRLGVVGSVENLPDGSVRVIAQAADDVLDDFAARLAAGPGSSSVDSIEAETLDPIEATSFEIVH